MGSTTLLLTLLTPLLTISTKLGAMLFLTSHKSWFNEKSSLTFPEIMHGNDLFFNVH